LWLLSCDQWEKDDVDCGPKGQSQRGTGHRAIDGRTGFQAEERAIHPLIETGVFYRFTIYIPGGIFVAVLFEFHVARMAKDTVEISDDAG
jgi:hypothetical protein